MYEYAASPGYQRDNMCVVPAVVGEAELWVYTRRVKEHRRTGAVRKEIVVLMVAWKTEHS